MLVSIYQACPAEMPLIGHLLLAYSELEVGLMHVVMAARKEFDAPFKAMYRIRGEEQRIKIADGLARQTLLGFEENLGNQFAIAISAMQWCRSIRNQYAHCQWYDGENGYVRFVALEDSARENKLFDNFSFSPVDIRRVNLALIQEQRSYFEYAEQMFLWVVHRTRVLRKMQNSSPYPDIPKPRDKPILYIPPDRHSYP